MYLNRWLPNHASFRPNHTAIICADTDKRLTYAELYSETLAACQSLKSHGIGRGDRVAIFAQNDVRFFPLFFAAARLGEGAEEVVHAREGVAVDGAEELRRAHVDAGKV